MRLRSRELWRLSLHGSTVHSSEIIYWGFLFRLNFIHFVLVLHEFRIYSGSSGVLRIHLSSVLLKDFRLVILPIRSDWTIYCNIPGVDWELVALVAIIFRVLHKVTVKGSLTVLGTNVGQTHLGSLEGKSTFTAWKLARRHKSVKKVSNITDPSSLSSPLPILISRCWISSPTSGFIVGRFV
jgi:hypothetical protein